MWGHVFFGGNINCMYDSILQPAIPLFYHFTFRCLVIFPFNHLAISPFHYPSMSRSPIHHYVFCQCMCHSTILRFHHRIIMTIARSHYSANPPCGHPIIPPLVSTSAFHRSAILPHHHFASPTHLKRSTIPAFQHSNILPFRDLVFFAFAFLPFHH